MVGSGSARAFTWLAFLVAFALLPFAPLSSITAPAYADPAVFDGKEIKDLCTISADGQSCPVFPPPPGLLNPGALAAAGPAVAQSMRNLSDQAIQNTLDDHQLPASDHDAALSWARDDAEAELWGLIVKAINTSASQRTLDQQHAAEWMQQLASAQANDAAKHAGEEYATWAGLDVLDYRSKADTATTAQLTDFLDDDVRSFSPLFTPRGGYCRYKPPDPYSTEYDGSGTQTCFTPCPGVLGCAVPTPTFEQFRKWGQAAATYANVTNPQFAAQATAIASGVAFGATVAAAGLAAFAGVAASITATITGTAFASAIWPFADALVTAAAGAAVIAVVTIVILAIIIAVMEAIRVTENALLPGKVAELVVNARTTVTDPATLIGTTDGSVTLYNLFVGATMPRPRTDLACDNSLVPPWAYSASFDPNLIVYVPLGGNRAITFPRNRDGCLNPPPIRVASATDPHFMVHSGNQTPQVAPTIQVVDPTYGAGKTMRLSGNWFVHRRDNLIGDAGQSLRLSYVDWNGVDQIAWLLRDDNGKYHFVGYQSTGSATSLDPDSCKSSGACWTATEIHYVNADGQQLTATVEGPAQPSGAPTYSPADPVEGSPVTFDANDFLPGGSTGHETYTWRFQHLGCGWIECVRNDQGVPAPPSYSDPVTGATATHTFESIGPAKVELTVQDDSGHTAQTVFVVNVGNVAPTVVMARYAWDADVGLPVQIEANISDAGERDDENIVFNYGDDTQVSRKLGSNSISLSVPGLPEAVLVGPASWNVTGTHTYTEPGIYYGTVTGSDWGGGTDFATFLVRAKGQQTVTFNGVADHTYGEQLTMDATGTLSGAPITYTTSPQDVCTATGLNGQTISLVGVGECTVTAVQQARPPTFLVSEPVQQSFDVAPAQVTITPDDKERVYGADDPPLTASFDGLVNGDTSADVVGLQLTGPPSSAGVGTHDITASGAFIPHYDIEYAAGTLEITPADLTITADDKTRVYGEDFPDYSFSFDGLVNGDDEGDFDGLTLSGGAPAGADVGHYTLTPYGTNNANYDITYENGEEDVTTAPLTITADDKTRVYGEDLPAYTASYDGFVNGDDEGDVDGLQINGTAQARAGVGDYEIRVNDATSPNYTITYVAGTEHVTPATLTITADDKTKVYGAAGPAFTASYDGLVNGDTKAKVTGLTFAGPPSGSGVGKYAITPSGASNPNYNIKYAAGTQTITPAPLTIRPADVAVASGQVPTYSWHGDGWVNGDSDATLSQPGHTPPTCTATVGAPGQYAGAVTCSGAHDANYDIAYAKAALRIDPVIFLDQRGLPDDVGRKAFLDGSPVNLPVVSLDVLFGSRHTYRFPLVRIGDAGTTYVTKAERFDGPVTANIDATARYLTMHKVLRRAEATGGVGRKEAVRLDQRWDGLQALIDPRRNAKLRAALHSFADRVRAHTGASIRTATARDLLAYADAVYQRIGGTGTL